MLNPWYMKSNNVDLYSSIYFDNLYNILISSALDCRVVKCYCQLNYHTLKEMSPVRNGRNVMSYVIIVSFLPGHPASGKLTLCWTLLHNIFLWHVITAHNIQCRSGLHLMSGDIKNVLILINIKPYYFTFTIHTLTKLWIIKIIFHIFTLVWGT